MAPILVLHPITRLIVGGAQENTMFTAAMLDKSRFRVEVLSGPQTGSEGSLIEEVRAREIPLIILPQLVRQINPSLDLIALWKLYRFIRLNHYTIVHTHSSKAGLIGRLAARLAGVPIIIHTVHGWSFHDHMSPWVRNAYIYLERWVANFTSVMIVVTEKDIQKGLQAKIGKPGQYRLIRSAIPLEEFDPDRYDKQVIRQSLGIPPQAPVIGNVGRFSEQKNPLDWVRVAGKINRILPDAWFLLVGDGPLHGQVIEAINQEGIAEKTVLTGLRRDIPLMMSAMDIFLLTSLWEGLPRVIPQAMAMRKPVVAYIADGTNDAIQQSQNGFLVPPGEIDAMAGYCVELLRNPEHRARIGQAGYEFARKEFDLRQMIAKISALYEEELSSLIEGIVLA